MCYVYTYTHIITYMYICICIHTLYNIHYTIYNAYNYI